MTDNLPALKATTEWMNLEVTGEPFVEHTIRGYAPLLPVRNMTSQEEGKLYISASSLGKQLEPLRQDNKGKFAGLKFRLKKESEDRMASYMLEAMK